MSKNVRLKLEGSLKRAYVRALRLRLAQAKRRDLEALMSMSCPVCKEVIKIESKEEPEFLPCDLCPVHSACRIFTNRRFGLQSQQTKAGWDRLVAWLEGLLEEACK